MAENAEQRGERDDHDVLCDEAGLVALPDDQVLVEKSPQFTHCVVIIEISVDR